MNEELAQAAPVPLFSAEGALSPDSVPTSKLEISDDQLNIVIGDSEKTYDNQVVPEREKLSLDRNNFERQKKINPYKERISKLTNDKKLAEQNNLILQSQLAEKERLLALKDHELRNRELNNQQLFENSLQAEERNVLQLLRTAKEEGDIDREISYQQDLARIKAEQSTYNMLRMQQNNTADDDESDTTFYPSTNPYQYDQYDQYSSPEELEPDLPEEYESFLDRNSWVNPRSAEYSPELASEANELALELNKRLKFNGQAAVIGTTPYFDAIENMMRERYSVNDYNESNDFDGNDNSYEPTQNQYKPSPVGGVLRQGATMADQYAMSKGLTKSRDIVRLTEEEYKIARNLQIPDPKRQGYFLSSEEAIKRYAENKARFSKMPHDPKFTISF